MSSVAKKQPIEVGILEISAQNRAILEFFFSGAGKSYFKEVDLDKASAYIIDYDSLGAKESWKTTFVDTKKPGIIISIKEVDLPSTIWLQKPLTVKALKDAGESIREMMLNKVSPKPVATISEEIMAKEENIIEIEPQEKNIQKEDVDTLFIEDIIDTPSEPLTPITLQDDILESLETVSEVQDTKVEKVLQEETLDFDDDLIRFVEETAETPTDDILTVETPVKTKKELSTILDSVSVAKEKPELAIADTKDSASSSLFAASSDFIDIDLSLNDINDDLDKNTSEKSSTTPIEKPVILNSDKESEIDSLLESLISGGENNERVEKLATTINDNNEGLADPETVELEAEETSDLAEPISVDTKTIEDNAEINKAPDEDNKTEEDESKAAEDELQSLLEEIRHEAGGGTTTEGNSIVKKYAPTNAAERWKVLCGSNDATDLQKIEFFEPSNHLLTPLIQNIKLAKQNKQVSRIKFNSIIIVIDPETDRIYCDQAITNDFYANICHEPIPLDKIKVHQLDKSEIRLYRKKMDEDSEHTHFTEAFIWSSSLLSSRGRLPKNTNMKSKIGLSSWPNLTRVEKIPHMMQIAALFHKNNWSLSELMNKSGIPKNYVIAFYNAALALDVIQRNGEATNSASFDLESNDAKNTGFLSRFINKITA